MANALSASTAPPIRRSYLPTSVYWVFEAVCMLPVVAIWFLLYRWSPDPP